MIINGKKYDFDNITVQKLLENLAINCDIVVVEVNKIIVPKTNFSEKIVYKDDHIEIVQFVGGG